MGNDDGHGPAGFVHRVEEHVMLLPFEFERGGAGSSGEHGTVDLVEGGRVAGRRGQVLHRVAHDQRFRRTYHDLAFAAHHHAECRRIDLHFPDQIREPVQGDIGREHRRHASPLVRHGNGIGGHEHVAAALVVIGFGPVSALQLQGLHIPFLVLVVVLRVGQAGGDDGIGPLVGIGRQILVRHGHGGAENDGVGLHQTHGNGLQAVRPVDLLLHAPQAVAHGCFHLIHHAGYFQLRGGQLAFRPARGLLREDALGVKILQDGRGFQGYNGNNHDEKTHPGRFFGCGIHFFSCHQIIPLRQALIAGMGHRVSRSTISVLSPA